MTLKTKKNKILENKNNFLDFPEWECSNENLR